MSWSQDIIPPFGKEAVKFSLRIVLFPSATTCFICNKPSNKDFSLAIQGEEPNTSFWLRDSHDTVIFTCGDDICFNIILLNSEEYTRIPF